MAVASICDGCYLEVTMISLSKVGEQNLCKKCVKVFRCAECNNITEKSQENFLDETTSLCNSCWLKLNQQPLKQETLN